MVSEAWAFRRPVICSDVGALAERVTDDVDGIHFTRGDPDALAAVMRRASTETGLWERLSGATPEPPSLAAMVAGFLDVYGLKQKPNGSSVRGSVPLPNEYQGHFDLCTSTRLGGWGVKNGMPAELDVLVNDRTIARIRCRWRRPDLVPHGLPINAGFEFVFDAPIAPSDKVSVRFAGGPELTNSPNKPLASKRPARSCSSRPRAMNS